MKKHLLVVAFFNCVCLVAQHKVAEKIAELQSTNVAFKPISVLTPTQPHNTNDIDKVVNDATFATVNMDKNNELVANRYEYIELAIPYQNQIYSVLLYQVNPLAEGFHVDTDKGKRIEYQKGVYYRGMIKGIPNSVASFNFFNGEFNGIFSSSTIGNVVVGKLFKTNNKTDYIVYSDAKMKVVNQFDCHVKEGSYAPHQQQTKASNTTLSTRCATIYFEIDNDLFIDNGSDTTTTTNWMTSVFNNVQTLYNNDGISVALKSIYIWTTQDPYISLASSSTVTSTDYLQAFNLQTPIFDGDLGQLIGVDTGGLGGVAVAINGLCTQDNYSYADLYFNYNTVPTFSWTVEVITHELGHLLGSPHTHGCYWNGNNTAIDGCGPTANAQFTEGTCPTGPIPDASVKGTIMSYCHLLSGVGISFDNGFGPQPAARILDAVNSASCLSLDCVNTCINFVSEITINNTTNTSVSFSWTDSGASAAWQVSVTPFASTAISWTNVSATDFTANGLTPNTYYKIRIRPLCSDSNVTSASKELIFATANTNLCNFAFTDTGGSGNNYTDMESWVRTMMPTGAGLKIKVTFTSFKLEPNFDYLYIYNGPDQYYPPLTSTGLTGTTVPLPYISTDTSGALTFKFTSDQAVNDTGWTANITCTGTLGQQSNDYIDFSYYPNPTNGKVFITSKDAITEIKVYNVAGQLLFSQNPNELNTNVDMTPFANGTYFFKLKFNDKEANFKILKM